MVIRAAFASRSRDGSIPFQRVPNAALVPLDQVAASDAELGGGKATLAS
jgi:hypothetical protein